MALGSIIAAAVAFSLPPEYHASTVMLAHWTPDDEALLRRGGSDIAPRYGEAMRRRALDPVLLERALQGTAPYGPVGQTGTPPADQIERLRSDLRVRGMSSSSFAIEFVHRDPVKAALLPNELARLLMDDTGPTHSAAPQNRLSNARFELVRAATTPRAPDGPTPVLFALTGAVGGLLMGLLASLLTEHRDRSVKGPEDLEDILPVPLLVTLPRLREPHERE